MPDDTDEEHPNVQELREPATLAEGMVWVGCQSNACTWPLMRMVTISNQSSMAKAWLEFDDYDRMKPSSYYDRIVDVMEELMIFTLLLRCRVRYCCRCVDRNASNANFV